MTQASKITAPKGWTSFTNGAVIKFAHSTGLWFTLTTDDAFTKEQVSLIKKAMNEAAKSGKTGFSVLCFSTGDDVKAWLDTPNLSDWNHEVVK